MAENFYQETTAAPETPFDLSLRPPGFGEFHGQEKIKERLMLMVEAARQRSDVLEVARVRRAEDAAYPDGVLVDHPKGPLDVQAQVVGVVRDVAGLDVEVGAELFPAHLQLRRRCQ